MKTWLAIALISAAPAAAHAQTRVMSQRPDAVAVTVYPPLAGVGLAMILETRTVMLPAGASRIEFRGVADQIVPQTVTVQGLPRPVSEQNFDYQLLTPGSLIRASEGRGVTLVRTNPTTGRVTRTAAQVVSGSNGAVLNIDGRVEALGCSDMPEGLVFNDLPTGFVAEPTLSMDLTSPRARKVTLTLSYLATGVEWGANYVAHLAQDGRTLNLTSWVTIKNDSETRFPDAPIQVIGGQLERRPQETRPVAPIRTAFAESCWEINTGRTAVQQAALGQLARGTNAGGYGVSSINLRNIGAGRTLMTFNGRRLGDEMASEDLGDYKLYRLPEATTLGARQAKQLFMFERRDVKYRAVQRLNLASAAGAGRRNLQQANPRPLVTVLELENREADGLGLPLPRGRIAVFDVTGGGALLRGETAVRDTARDAPLQLQLDANPLVQARTRLVDDQFVGTRRRIGAEVDLTNGTSRPVVIQVREQAGAPGLRVRSQSHTHRMKDGWLQWDVTVPANGSATLTYNLDWQARV